MFRQLFAALLVLSAATAINFPTQEQYSAELKSAGMSQGGIDGLAALSQKFASGYVAVQSNKEATDKFIAEYTVDAQKYVDSMSPEDQKIYKDSLVKYGLA